MKLIKKLGLVAVMAGVLALVLTMGLGGGTSSATTPADPNACYCTQPALSLSVDNVYWASTADYTNRILSIDYNVSNNSDNYANARNLHVLGTTNSAGVILTNAGRTVNMVPVGDCESLTLQYNVPAGVGSFSTRVHAETSDICGNSYNYGGAMP